MTREARRRLDDTKRRIDLILWRSRSVVIAAQLRVMRGTYA